MIQQSHSLAFTQMSYNSYLQKNLHTNVYSSFFIIVKTWKQSWCSTRWMNKQTVVYPYYIKRNEVSYHKKRHKDSLNAYYKMKKRQSEEGYIVYDFKRMTFWKRQNYTYSEKINGCQRCMGGLLGGSGVKNPPAMQEPQEMRIQPLGWEDPLRGTATHSSILVWRILWKEAAGGLQSMELQSRTGLKWFTTRARDTWARKAGWGRTQVMFWTVTLLCMTLQWWIHIIIHL